MLLQFSFITNYWRLTFCYLPFLWKICTVIFRKNYFLLKCRTDNHFYSALAWRSMTLPYFICSAAEEEWEELELVLGWLSEFDRMVLPSNSSCLTPQLWLYGTFFVFSENTGSFIHFLELIFSVTQLYCFFIF